MALKRLSSLYSKGEIMLDIIKLINSVESNFQNVTSGPGEWWTKIGPLSEIVCKEVEGVSKDLKGEDKKEAALNILLSLWFKYANIKWVPDMIEFPLVRHIFSISIDAVVAALNKAGIFVHKKPNS